MISRQQRRWLIAMALATPLLIIGWLLAQRLGGLGYLQLRLEQALLSEDHRASSLWLPDYRVEVEARPISNLEDLSALTYDPDRNLLVSVTNTNPHVVEMSLQGELLRQIPLYGFHDPEAIEYLSPGIFLVSDEENQRIIKIRLDSNTKALRAKDFQQISLRFDLKNNKGFEGLAWDPYGKRVLVAKERDPVRLYEVIGFPHTSADKPLMLDVREANEYNRSLFVSDISSLQVDPHTGHLLILSDESHLLVEVTRGGKPVSSLSLLPGQHGLRDMVQQAEGVALDGQGTLYLVSEPNLFYVFRKTPVAP